MKHLTIGVIVNPLAGIGGAVGLKGSDGADIIEAALAAGAHKRASLRMQHVLEKLKDLEGRLHFVCYPQDMGENSCKQAGFIPQVMGDIDQQCLFTTAQDTENAAKALVAHGIDLLLFAGGDGTARDIFKAIGDRQVVLGVPAGVKIHSGVYAVNSEGAAAIIRQLLAGELVALGLGEVRDIDEGAFRHGKVKTRYFGELTVPVGNRYLQQVKCSGVLPDELALDDIAEDVVSNMDRSTCYIIGPGSTTAAIMAHLGLDNTLLGVDVIQDKQLIAQDVSEQQLVELVNKDHCKIIITPIGGQGHILGRGNHQLGPEIVKTVGKENIIVVATESKLRSLEGRPLLVDSYDESVNQLMKGLITVVTGFENSVLYRVE